jgi:hypothetical protein
VRTRTSLLSLALSLAVGLGLAAAVLARRSQSAPSSRGTAARALTFTSARTSADALPPEAQGFAVSSRPPGVPSELFEGAWLTDRSRLLRTVKGKWDASLYVVPTSMGRLCQVLVVQSAKANARSPATGGCVRDFAGSTPIGLIVFDPDAVDAGGPVIVAGVVPNRVVAIRVVAHGKSYPARIQNSAYLYELGSSTAYPEAIRIIYADGAIRTLALTHPRPVAPRYESQRGGTSRRP